MKKHIIRRGLMGFLLAIAIQYILAIGVSLMLRLGYLLPYPASFAERFGGEMNAVLMVTIASGCIGLLVGSISVMFVKPR